VTEFWGTSKHDAKSSAIRWMRNQKAGSCSVLLNYFGWSDAESFGSQQVRFTHDGLTKKARAKKARAK
jgi:hypothetical protein